MADSTTVAVLFRVDTENGEVNAVFPGLVWDRGSTCYSGKAMMTCFTHAEQHGGCSRDWVRYHTRAAKEAEYEALKRELEAPPYSYKLQVHKRMSKKLWLAAIKDAS